MEKIGTLLIGKNTHLIRAKLVPASFSFAGSNCLSVVIVSFSTRSVSLPSGFVDAECVALLRDVAFVRNSSSVVSTIDAVCLLRETWIWIQSRRTTLFSNRSTNLGLRSDEVLFFESLSEACFRPT